MVILKTPDAPATSRQLWRLHQLTGDDTSDLKLTMQEASERIGKLENRENKVALPPQFSRNKTPFNYAHVAFITGEQGGGKSVTAVARVRDNYDKDCIKVFCENVLGIKNFVVKSYDRRSRMAKIRYDGSLKLLHIPKSYKLYTDLKIFCNFHLFGIRYRFIPSFQHLAKWLNDGTISDGWLIIDEYYLGGYARESMSALARRLSQLSQQFRKRQLEVIIMCQLARMADWTMRITPTEHISCDYNPVNHRVTLKIRKKGVKGEKTLSYDPRPYWGNYWTNELVAG